MLLLMLKAVNGCKRRGEALETRFSAIRPEKADNDVIHIFLFRVNRNTSCHLMINNKPFSADFGYQG